MFIHQYDEINATFTICGKFLRAIATTYDMETYHNTRVNSPGHGKNAMDWIIRRECLKCFQSAMIESTTTVPQRLGVNGCFLIAST